MTALELIQYYANLLIIQYVGKPKAYDTVSTLVTPVIMPQVSTQELTFSRIAASGAFVLEYDEVATSSLSWNASSASIQTALRLLPGLSSITVTGSIASQSLTVTFTGVTPPALTLSVSTNTLLNGSSLGVAITITETDQTLPLAVQNGFNLLGSDTAVGAQLDILGKYAGVVRTGNGPYGPITLDDADFLTLIKFAIVQNSSGSSLETIELNLNKFFPNQFIVTDYRNMYMSYVFSASLGSQNLFILLLNENLVPKPMGVGLSVIIPPQVDDFFGFRTYDSPNTKVKPFNTYDDFNTSWLFLSYDDAFTL